MPLSAHEQRQLERLEKQLHEDDPRFADAMELDLGRSLSTGYLVTFILCALGGVTLLLVGVTSPNLIVGVLGFTVMGCGFYFTTMRRKPSVAEESRAGGQWSTLISSFRGGRGGRCRGQP